MQSATRSGGTAQHGRPMTTASSGSCVTLHVPGGMRIASPGPITEVDGLRKRIGSAGAGLPSIATTAR